MSVISEMHQCVDQMGRTVHELRAQHDRFEQELKKKGSADTLTQGNIQRLNDTIDQLKDRQRRLETVLNRPETEVKSAFSVASDSHPGEYGQAFRAYLRKGMEQSDMWATKALSVGSDPDGGYFVTPAMASEISKTISTGSPLRSLAAVETISSDALEILDDHDDAGAGWTTETGSVSDTTTPQIGKRSIPVHELYAQPKATQKLIDDSAIDIEQWLAGKVADIFAAKESEAFINGSGSGQPRGLLTYTAGTDWGEIEQINSGSSGAVTSDGLVKLYYALKQPYARQASFIMNRSVIQAVRLLKESTTDQYLWQPGLATGAPDTLLGVPVIEVAEMPAATSNSLSVAVADFKRAYQIVDRTGVQVLRDPYTDKPFVKFYTTKRVGGDVLNFEAIKILKLAV